jgi:hypothetical protein
MPAARSRGRSKGTSSVPPARRRAAGHHGDALGQEQRLVDVMRDHQRRLARRRPRIDQHLLQLEARERVEHAERLVEEQDFGSSAKARALPTRWRMPADSSAGFLSSASDRRTRSRFSSGTAAANTPCAARRRCRRSCPCHSFAVPCPNE